MTALTTAAISLGCTAGLMLSFGVSSATADKSARANPTLCVELANATPESPAAFRLADETSTSGGC